MTETTQSSETRDYTVRLTVTGQDVSDDAVRAAVAEAGYEVVAWAELTAPGATISAAPTSSSPRHTKDLA